MTREEFRDYVEFLRSQDEISYDVYSGLIDGIDTLEQQPYEKFESTKDHIYKLAGDYKCWDNRLTENEAVELCHILEQQPCYNPDEWCHDCSEYDHEKHCCPRYNKVIRTAVEEMKQEQEPCDKCEVGNPCLYCKHEFEPQESEDKE